MHSFFWPKLLDAQVFRPKARGWVRLVWGLVEGRVGSEGEGCYQQHTGGCITMYINAWTQWAVLQENITKKMSKDRILTFNLHSALLGLVPTAHCITTHLNTPSRWVSVQFLWSPYRRIESVLHYPDIVRSRFYIYVIHCPETVSIFMVPPTQQQGECEAIWEDTHMQGTVSSWCLPITCLCSFVKTFWSKCNDS